MVDRSLETLVKALSADPPRAVDPDALAAADPDELADALRQAVADLPPAEQRARLAAAFRALSVPAAHPDQRDPGLLRRGRWRRKLLGSARRRTR